MEKQIKSKPSKRKHGFHNEMFAETNYYTKNGLRFVYPYKFTFVAHVKLRWVGLKVIELFQKEFQMESVDYYENAILNGKITVNGKNTMRDYILTGRDILQTSIHRHEPPIIDEPIEFVENNEDMVVINKPSSIPVHPCGRYRHNTVVFLLGKLHGLHSLHTIHRIDRLTSGILMFAKNSNKSRELEKVVKNREVEKEYFARVVGEFPKDEILVDKPILVVSHKVGVCRISDDGKEASTIFRRKSYNGHSSVVSCIPKTGRMHQIRVHLQWLGHPIINDPIYNHKTAWGEAKGNNVENVETSFIVSELLRTRKDKTYDIDESYKHCKDESDNSNEKRKHTLLTANECEQHEGNEMNSKNKKQKLEDDCSTSQEGNSHYVESGDSSKNIKLTDEKLQETEHIDSAEGINYSRTENTCQNEFENEHSSSTYMSRELGEEYFDPICSDCKRIWKEPTREELVMCLHAYSYKGPGWEYKTSIPEWANEDWIENVEEISK